MRPEIPRRRPERAVSKDVGAEVRRDTHDRFRSESDVAHALYLAFKSFRLRGADERIYLGAIGFSGCTEHRSEIPVLGVEEPGLSHRRGD